MSRHYLLDGYNIIHQAPSLAHGSLEERRAALVRWLNQERPQGSVRNQVTVVFDGNSAFYGNMALPVRQAGGGDIKVVFSDGQDADTCIKAAVERSRQPKDLVVVTDDKAIKLYARALGASVLGVREFAPSLFSAKGGVQKRTKAQTGDGKYISMVKADKINKEFEKLWLQ